MTTADILKEVHTLPESQKMEVGIRILNECSSNRERKISTEEKDAINSVLLSRIKDGVSEPFPDDWKQEVKDISQHNG